MRLLIFFTQDYESCQLSPIVVFEEFRHLVFCLFQSSENLKNKGKQLTILHFNQQNRKASFSFSIKNFFILLI
ncbi:hypothetical protein A4V04_07200 [Burkholderiales bacterium YL45]|uniref:Uncharacterized protein n=1 Tax=Turicimonas muris TaxID=1796652 RepID=A0A227KAD6_9BURK|nr:hypothetical protein A4V04_07200 [Burkholderiales bacterium YL45]OXE44177.1 hypothetical protein ADH67_12935 [Turicimonas muris]